MTQLLFTCTDCEKTISDTHDAVLAMLRDPMDTNVGKIYAYCPACHHRKVEAGDYSSDT